MIRRGVSCAWQYEAGVGGCGGGPRTGPQHCKYHLYHVIHTASLITKIRKGNFVQDDINHISPTSKLLLQ